jgi:hypothetical protein
LGIEFPAEATVTVLIKPPRTAPGVVTGCAAGEISLRLEAAVGVHTPLRVVFGGYEVLSETIEEEPVDGGVRVVAAVAHLLAVDKLAGHSRFWS